MTIDVNMSEDEPYCCYVYICAINNLTFRKDMPGKGRLTTGHGDCMQAVGKGRIELEVNANETR